MPLLALMLRVLRGARLARLAPCGVLFFALGASGQISLSTAVDLSLKNSPRVKMAQADLARAKAVLAESKDAFIPAIAATGGVGKATGAPLSPPVIFSIGAQSLVFSMSQPDLIRAAHSGVDSAQLALEAIRSDTAEDTISTYVTLDNALQRRDVQRDAMALAGHLVSIVQDRFTAGVDPHIELTKSKRTEAQIGLQQLLIEDEIVAQSEHLARVTGLQAAGLGTVHSSIPAFQLPSISGPPDDNRLGISAAFAAARAKQYTAHGEKRYLLRPQVAFSANYSRISTAFTTYTQYYPGYNAPANSFNSLELGVQFTVPILDMVHRSKAREYAADAAHSLFEAQAEQNQFLESRSKLRHTALELIAQHQLASLDRDLAQDQLDAVLLRLQAAAGASTGDQLTPKDAENARLDERRRTLDMLNSELQLQQTEVMLLRQEGSLTSFLAASLPGSATTAPGSGSPASLPPTVGVEPGAGSPAGTTPAGVPTVGTTPSSLPSAPVVAPAPTTPPAPPSATPKP